MTMDIDARRSTAGYAGRIWLILAISAAAFAALCMLRRVPLGAGYHDFADTRTLWSIPNALDVLSNIPFMLAGAMGAGWLLFGFTEASYSKPVERVPYLIFFLGVLLTGFGSWWYHLAPSNARLPWDLLPMTCCFMSMVAAVVMERISLRAGLWLLPPLLALGLASVAYWNVTEAAGHGDYRFYLFVQFFSPALLMLIIGLFPPCYTGLRYLVAAFLMFVAAKLFETFDAAVYRATGLISGHAIKHALAGVACYWVLRMLQHRHPVAAARKTAPATHHLEHQSISS
jgi:hypothetical protein